MDRRKFLCLVGLSITSGCSRGFVSKTNKPNVLVILTDQQSATMMSCTGNPWLKTPAMDSLMKKGMRFERAYAANPVCMPSRFSLMTGFYPSDIGVRSNASESSGTETFVNHAIGWTFRRGGYQTVYGGKVHLHGEMAQIDQCGFDILTADERDELADTCADFLRQKHKKPFFMVASFINPHDICYQGLVANGNADHIMDSIEVTTLKKAEKYPDGVNRDQFYKDYCPPLPSNYEVSDDEPKAIKYALKQRDFKDYIRENWSDEDWRLHRWAYARLTEMVDEQISRVLKALRESGQEDNTIIVLTSDHGDMDAAHKLEHKSMTFEEASRIPFMIQYSPMTKAGYVDREHLVCNGLDMFVTLCDMTGIRPENKLPGRSVKPLLKGESADNWRQHLMIQTEFGWGIVDDRYKYTLYDAVGLEETLFDMQEDPGEMKNLAGAHKYKPILAKMRNLLREESKKCGMDLDIPKV